MKTAAVRSSRQVRRRTFAAHVFGLSYDRTIGTLKQHLHDAGLSQAADEKLDLVMVDDYEHFTELVAIHGIPLARDEVDVVLQRTRVTLRIHPGWLTAGTMLLAVNLLDDVLSVFGVTVIPWF